VGKTVVLGLGNILRRDDGVGVRALPHVRERLGATDEIRLVDGGTAPFEALVGHGGGALVVLDAANGDGPPGAVYVAGREDIAPKGEIHSLHGLGLAETLVQLEVAGVTWESVSLIGVEPASTDWGEDLSRPVRDALPAVAEHVERMIAAHGAGQNALTQRAPANTRRHDI
jgi:hydrogenase maturation protease